MHCFSSSSSAAMASTPTNKEDSSSLHIMVTSLDDLSIDEKGEAGDDDESTCCFDVRPISPDASPATDDEEQNTNTTAQSIKHSRIRFDDNILIISLSDSKPSSEMTDEEKKRIWWQDADYDSFKRTAKVIGGEVQRRQSANHSRSSYSSIMLRTYAACCSSSKKTSHHRISEADKRSLRHWAEVGICRRGLEKWCMPRMARDRSERKLLAIHGVIQTQKDLDPSLSFSTRAEALRIRSERLTRSSRQFALALGEADATTIVDDSDDNNDPKHVSPMKLLLRRKSMIVKSSSNCETRASAAEAVVAREGATSA